MRKTRSLRLKGLWPEAWHVARSVAAALAAYAIAVALKLESPYWAAMTSIIIIQPTGGQLLEKSFYRFVGTLIGALAGLLMLLPATSSLNLTIMLCLWLGVCVGAGNLQLYGYRSYGFMVAGFTAAVIALDGWSHPARIGEIVFARIGCIGIGIAFTTMVNISFTPRNGMKKLKLRLQEAVAASMGLVSLVLRDADHAGIGRSRHDILFMLADIEKTLDGAGAGTLDLKRRRFHIENLLVDLLSLLETSVLLEGRTGTSEEESVRIRRTLADRLDQVTSGLERAWSPIAANKEFERLVAEIGTQLPVLRDSLLALPVSLGFVLDRWDSAPPKIPVAVSRPVLRQRDWPGAVRASMRTIAAVGLTGAVWQLTGWKEGAAMMLATSIMVSVFSTHDHPSVLLSHIFRGAFVGVLLAFIFRLFVIPGQSGPFIHGLLTFPILVGGMIAKNHRKTALGAMDTMMFFLLVMQPGMPMTVSRTDFLMGGAAGLAGIGVALVSFRYVIALNPALRLRSILVSIASDLLLMTGTDSTPALERCRNRTRYRVLRMLHNARLMNRDMSAVVEGSLAALALSGFLKRFQEGSLKSPHSDRFRTMVDELGTAISISGMNPEELIPLIKEASLRFSLLEQAEGS